MCPGAWCSKPNISLSTIENTSQDLVPTRGLAFPAISRKATVNRLKCYKCQKIGHVAKDCSVINRKPDGITRLTFKLRPRTQKSPYLFTFHRNIIGRPLFQQKLKSRLSTHIATIPSMLEYVYLFRGGHKRCYWKRILQLAEILEMATKDFFPSCLTFTDIVSLYSAHL